jgi:3-hydroxyisobutyrate dehydrogenase
VGSAQTRQQPAAGRSVGLAGLGNLGMPMVGALLDAGWAVTAFDQRADLVARCADLGAAAASTPLDLAGCPVVGVVVTDDDAVFDVLVHSGLLDALAAGGGAAVAVHSTVLPVTAARLGQRADTAGVHLADAPVSGGADRARRGDLTVFAGGRPAAVQALDGYLRTVASSVVRVGDVGAGSAAKLGNQLMMFAALAAAHEALDLGAAYGVAADAFLDAVTSSTGDSWVARNWGFFDRVAADYDASGLPPHVRPWSKDLWDVVAAARVHDLALPLAGLLAHLVPARVEAHAAAAREAGS